QLLAALWALVREWDLAGRPKPSVSHASFPAWSDWIAGVVENAGFGCPAQGSPTTTAGDQEAADMRSLMSLLVRENQRQAWKFHELIGLSRQNGLFDHLLDEEPNGASGRSERSRLGKLLRRFEGRLFVFDSCSCRFHID